MRELVMAALHAQVLLDSHVTAACSYEVESDDHFHKFVDEQGESFGFHIYDPINESRK